MSTFLILKNAWCLQAGRKRYYTFSYFACCFSVNPSQLVLCPLNRGSTNVQFCAKTVQKVWQKTLKYFSQSTAKFEAWTPGWCCWWIEQETSPWCAPKSRHSDLGSCECTPGRTLGSSECTPGCPSGSQRDSCDKLLFECTYKWFIFLAKQLPDNIILDL